MRVLWLTSWYPNRLDEMNGDFIQRHAYATALYCKVDVIHLEADKENKLQQQVARYVQQKPNLTETIILYKPTKVLGPLSKALALRQYVRLMKKEVQQYIREQGVPDLVHVHVPMKAGLVALWMKRKYGTPYLVTEHWTIYQNLSADGYNKRSFLFRYYTQRIFRNAVVFLPVSDNLGSIIKNSIAKINYTIIPNAVDIELFRYAPPAVKEPGFRFIHVSTMHYQKNPEAIVQAFSELYKRYPGARLVMAGNTDDKLQQWMRKQHISSDGISFTGLIPYTEVAKEMQKSDALVMFSRYENLPCVILESLCCGLPVITSDAGGIAEVIDETNGILLQKYEPIFLLNAMITLYEQQGHFNRKQISLRASEQFSYAAVGREIFREYQKIAPV